MNSNTSLDSLRNPQFLVTIIIACIFGYVVFSVMSGSNNDMKNYIAGQVVGIAGTMVAFWFNSTIGSQRKDALAASSTVVTGSPVTVTTENGNGTDSR